MIENYFETDLVDGEYFSKAGCCSICGESGYENSEDECSYCEDILNQAYISKIGGL